MKICIAFPVSILLLATSTLADLNEKGPCAVYNGHITIKSDVALHNIVKNDPKQQWVPYQVKAPKLNDFDSFRVNIDVSKAGTGHLGSHGSQASINRFKLDVVTIKWSSNVKDVPEKSVPFYIKNGDGCDLNLSLQGFDASKNTIEDVFVTHHN